MGIKPEQLSKHVIEPVLKQMGYYNESAVNLLLMTAAVESDMGEYIAQIGGPALGIYQMEPDTHDDIWGNFLGYRPEMAKIVELFYPRDRISAYEMPGNLYYATAMARVLYLRVPEALPEANDVPGLAAYWKKYYNTELGMGTVDAAIHKYKNLVLGERIQWKL